MFLKNQKRQENFACPLDNPFDQIHSQLLYLSTGHSTENQLKSKPNLFKDEKISKSFNSFKGSFFTLRDRFAKLKESKNSCLSSYFSKTRLPDAESHCLKNIVTKLVLRFKQVLHSKLQMPAPPGCINLYACHVIKFRD